MMKKIFRIIICLAFILTIHCSAVLADDDASTLSQDMIIEDTIVIENDTVYDLKGHKIYLKEDCSGRLFYVKKGSTLTIKDSEGGGIITGGTSLGGNVYETDLYDFGRGEVRDITEGCGGGVYVEKGAKLIMAGGKITGNRAEQGGGVYLESGAELHVSGEASITGNCFGDTDSIADNVFLPFDSDGKQSEIIVDDALADTAIIGITPATRSADSDKEIIVTSGLKNHGIAANFTSDEGKPVYLNNSGETVFNMGKAAASVTYSVTISAGSNMTKTTDSGAASQTELSGAMEDVAYMANDGYYFPENYVDSCTVTANSGISVTRNSYTQITVSGTPTADAAITLTAPTAKTTPDAPTGLTATKASSSTATDGTISNVTDAMEYQKDGDTSWTAVGNGKTEITGLTAGTYKVRYAGTADKNSSPATSVVVGVKATQTITASDVIATYGDTGKSVSASVTDPAEGSGAISYAVKSGSENYIDVNASTGALTIKAVPPTDGKAYVTVTAAETNTCLQATKEVTVTINKANATPANVTSNNRTYDGTEKPLVTVTGQASGGEMQYALGTATEATEAYSKSIPAKTDAGTYYVWYKVAGDEHHKDTAPVCVTVKISENPAASKPVALIKATAKGKTALKFKWNKVSGAAKYEVWMTKCGKKSTIKKVKTLRAPKTSWTKKKLKKNTAHRFYVVAKDASGNVICKSFTGYAYTGNVRGKYTNAKSLKVKKSSFTLNKGGTAKIKATQKKARKGKKLCNHAKLLRYKSNNTSVAKVSSSGKITAVGSGTCTVYVQTVNGIWKTVKVTVK